MKSSITIHTGTVISVLAVVMAACFIVPVFMVSPGGQDITISGGRLLLGIQTGAGRDIDANLGMLTLLYIPVTVLLVWCIYRGKQQHIKDAALLSVVLSAAGLLGWLAVFWGVAFYTAKYGVQYKIAAGYPVCILGYTAMLILSSGKLYMTWIIEGDPFYSPKQNMRSVKIKEQAGMVPAAPVKLYMQSLKQDPAPADSESRCPNCHQPARPGFAFCTKCGSKI